MPQIGFPLSEAHKALDEFLAEMRDGEQANERWISKGEDREQEGIAAYIVPADEYDEMSRGHQSWVDSQEVVGLDDDLPPAYRPWRHSPLAVIERLLPIEPLCDPLSRVFYGKPFAELPNEVGVQSRERDKVEFAAIAALLRVTLDPDGQGAVPILSVGHHADEPGQTLRWLIAFVTPVPGLFLRATGNGFLEGQWGILSGSGWRVVDGFHDRESALACAEALGRTLPNTDWMRLTPDEFTPAAVKAVRETVTRYQRWGLNEKAPEPEPMTDAVPAEAIPAEPEPAR